MLQAPVTHVWTEGTCSACPPLSSALQAPGSAVPQLGLTPCPGHELWSSQAGFFSCVGQSLCLLRSCCCPRATCCSQPSTTGREVTLWVLWLPTCQGQKPGGLLEIRPQEDRGHLHPWSSFPSRIVALGASRHGFLALGTQRTLVSTSSMDFCSPCLGTNIPGIAPDHWDPGASWSVPVTSAAVTCKDAVDKESARLQSWASEQWTGCLSQGRLTSGSGSS